MYVLIWSVGGETRRFPLRGRRYFLGRPHDVDLEALGQDVSGADVVVFNPDDYSDYTVTGYQSLTVSRRHALLYRRSDGRLAVRDHGRDGGGTPGGTFVNGRPLGRGGEAVLGDGDSVRLGEDGPLFTVSVEAGAETTVPAEASSTSTRPGGGMAVGAESADERVNVVKTLAKLHVELSNVVERLERGEEDEARRIMESVLGLETVYREALSRVKGGERVAELIYDVVAQIMRLSTVGQAADEIRAARDMLQMILDLI